MRDLAERHREQGEERFLEQLEQVSKTTREEARDAEKGCFVENERTIQIDQSAICCGSQR